MITLTQSEIADLLQMDKRLKQRTIAFPGGGDKEQYKLYLNKISDTMTLHIIAGKKNKLKYTFAEVYDNIPLLRVDLHGQVHWNPDGKSVPTPHIHIYQEEYEDKIAYPLPSQFAKTDDPIELFIDYLKYSHVINYNKIQIISQGGIIDE